MERGMRGVPPVALVCDGGIAWRVVCSGLPALAAAALVAWIAGHARLGAPGQAVAALAAALAAGCVAWRAAAPLPQALAWDGQTWRLGAAGEPGRVDVMIDLGGWLLLRHVSSTPGTPPAWLAVSAAAAGTALHGLRVALQVRVAAAPAGIESPERQPR